ncbi:hypothetical protein BH20ACT6_BH20ACT6_24580 [soil metagenome]
MRQVAYYEADAAIELEGLAHRALGSGRHGEWRDPGAGAYRFARQPGTTDRPAVADAAPVVRAVVDDVRGGVEAGVIVARFHAAVADLVQAAAAAARADTGLETVVLGGGVFQNVLLLSAARSRLAAAGFTVLTPRRLPPNDGGIALGQLLVATAT